MSDQSGTSPPIKKVRYHQGTINTMQLHLNEKFADVNFLFGSDDGTVTRVPAHKTLLAMNSNVFEKMFFGELKEIGDVPIVDASAAAFKEFLQFFYLNEVKLSPKHIAAVMNLGNKYNVEKCMDSCVEILKNGLTDKSVCTALSLAVLYDHKQLMKACEKPILVSTVAVFASAGFLECSKEALAYILRMKLLSCSEVEVFEACMAWVQAKSKQTAVSKAMVRKHLGELYYEIRYASMTIQEFCTLEAKYNAVLSSDFKTIIQLIAQRGKTSGQFNTAPRQIEWNENAILECKNEWMISKRYLLDCEENTIFSATEPLLLGGFVCNNILFGGSSSRAVRSVLLVEVNIREARALHGANAKVLTNMVANLKSFDNTVSLPQPILIRPDFFYSICISKFPDDYWFHSKDQLDLAVLDSNIVIRFHNVKIVQGSKVRLISTLNFNKI